MKPVEGNPHPHPARIRTIIGMPASGIVQTALDGSFAIPNVAPGSYYVIVTASGYLSPRPQRPTPMTMKHCRLRPRDNRRSTIPKVDVTGRSGSANIDIRLERGAAVSGTIRFDDGSPAANVHVVHAPSQEQGQMGSSTDGRLRRLRHAES